MLAAYSLHAFAGSGQCGADGVFGDSQFGADLSVRATSKVVLADDVSISGRQAVEHALHLLAILNALHVPIGCGLSLVERRLVRIHMAESLGHFSSRDFSNDDPSSDDREVSHQRAIAFEAPQCSVIVGEQRYEDFSTQVVDVVTVNRNAPSVSRMVDDMNKKPDEAINKVLPRIWLFSHAALQEIAIEFGEGHVNTTPGKRNGTRRPPTTGHRHNDNITRPPL